MLAAEDVFFAYDRDAPVLRGVTVSAAPGEIVGILGPNGSGKTTLLKILGGLIRPSSGRASVDGKDLATMRRRDIARRLAMVPQETRLAFDYTVMEVVLMGRYPHLAPFELEGQDDLEDGVVEREAGRLRHDAHPARERAPV